MDAPAPQDIVPLQLEHQPPTNENKIAINQ
jgi:hypothetical protein